MPDRIVIAGGGPVGLTLSLVLARYGVPVLVLEARSAPTPADESRAITWMPRGLELLDWLGLGEKFDRSGLRRTMHEFWSPDHHLLSLRFDGIDTPYPYTLQLTQHDTEVLLEEEALATGLVEIRRGHRVVGIGQGSASALLRVESPAGTYEELASWAVAADGAGSDVRHMLGVEATWRDYKTNSAVADFEMQADLPEDRSRIVLDARRPHGFFYFAPGRWRFIYRINRGEDRGQMTTPAVATELLKQYLPGARVGRFLWASGFALRQGQATTYRKGRWLLAGDAAHAMGPSAGAGMMIGVLGAWRLGWRLALAAKGHGRAEALLDDYNREQHAAADDIQGANAIIFRNMAIDNPLVGAARTLGLSLAGRLPRVTERMTAREALVAQVLPVSGSADRPDAGGFKTIDQVGIWKTGRRVPAAALSSTGLTHVLLPIGHVDHEAERALCELLVERSPVPLRPPEGQADRPEPWREAGLGVAFALVRPDQHIAAIYRGGE